MADPSSTKWPICIRDRNGHSIYITRERWEHALEHPGMKEDLLKAVLSTLRSGRRRQDRFEPAKFFSKKSFAELPFGHTHLVAVVKFGWRSDNPSVANNFLLTA